MSLFPKFYSLPRLLRSTAFKAIVAILIVVAILQVRQYRPPSILPHTSHQVENEQLSNIQHPIERLVRQGIQKHKDFLHRQSKTPEEAVSNYKLRYSRDPPPGFLEWARYALEQNSTVIDDFDTIEKVLKPFRSLNSTQLQSRIEWTRQHGGRLQTISIKDGAFSVSRIPIVDSLGPVVKNLPDLSFLLNELDEPRVIGSRIREEKPAFEDFSRHPAWEHLTASCDFSAAETEHPHYIESAQTALDLCKNPSYKDKYGMFTSPCTFLGTKDLVPIFSVARVSTMRDILAPGHDYHSTDFLNKNDVDPQDFKSKLNKVYWRGSNTGTWATSRMDWRTNHRARFMIKVRNNTELFDVGMTAYIQCDWSVCNDMEKTFGKPPRGEKGASYNYRYAMDLDGNGYSGRFYRLMLSNSVVFKQTLVEQWHDDRLFPWVHYVPVSLSMDEIEDLATFFITKGESLAEIIAAESTEWVKKSLRPVDMTIYEYRLFLEYAELFKEKI